MGKKKTENRNNLELKCSVCGFIIRPTEKNKAKTPERLEIKKFCKKCNKTQTFNEKK
ncbi:MAG: 50S ribosomal protein L33 [Mollicutes bacterium]|jgi:large subunit ribosomal protein L33|nr:50S ribosomal protein L33 [Mollicutes bacterium]